MMPQTTPRNKPPNGEREGCICSVLLPPTYRRSTRRSNAGKGTRPSRAHTRIVEGRNMLAILIAILGAFAGRLATNHNATALRG